MGHTGVNFHSSEAEKQDSFSKRGQTPECTEASVTTQKCISRGQTRKPKNVKNVPPLSTLGSVRVDLDWFRTQEFTRSKLLVDPVA